MLQSVPPHRTVLMVWELFHFRKSPAPSQAEKADIAELTCTVKSVLRKWLDDAWAVSDCFWRRRSIDTGSSLYRTRICFEAAVNSCNVVDSSTHFRPCQGQAASSASACHHQCKCETCRASMAVRAKSGRGRVGFVKNNRYGRSTVVHFGMEIDVRERHFFDET